MVGTQPSSDSHRPAGSGGVVAFGAMLRDHVSPWLRERGFMRSGNRFVKWHGKNCQVVKFLTDNRGSGGVSLFTLYLGIFSTRLWYLDNGYRSPPKVPDQPQCHWGGLLERFFPRYRDQWFAISSEEQVHQLAQEILKLLEGEVLPLLLPVATDEGLRDYWLTGRAPGAGNIQRLMYLTCLCYEIGPRDKASAFFHDLQIDAGGTPAGDRALMILSALTKGKL